VVLFAVYVGVCVGFREGDGEGAVLGFGMGDPGVYVGVRVGLTVGAELGDALGAGVGTSGM